MEINRTFKPAVSPLAEAQGAHRQERAARPAATAQARPASAELPLEQLQEALGSLPDVDLDKVAALKAALKNGELSSDVDSLARSMLAHHRGGAV
jgi:negative regulator of flagellin synthesis FlgM